MSSKVSILLVLNNNCLDIINNILNQTYDNFELLLIDKFSNYKNIFNILKNEKIQYLNINTNHNSELIDSALKITNGEFIFIANENNIYNDQCIEIFVKSLNKSKWSDIAYSGYLFNNKEEVAKCITPIDFLLNFNINYPIMFRKKSIENIELNTNLNNLSIFDMYLQILENNKHLIAINNILTKISTLNTYKENEINNFVENLFIRNNNINNILDVNKYYPFINDCKNKKRFMCISNYELAMNILNNSTHLKKYLLKDIYRYFELSYNNDRNFTASLINLLIYIGNEHEDYNRYYSLLNLKDNNTLKNNLENKIYVLENLNNEEIIIKKKIYTKRNSISFEIKNPSNQNNLCENIIKKNNNILIYYSKTPWNLLFQRPHQICRFLDNNFLKVFICSEANICSYDEKYNLLVVSYVNKDQIFNNINNLDEKIIYYTDPRLFNEIKKNQENGFKILFDLIDAPIDEFSVWKPNLENSVKNADWVIYSHPKLLDFLNEIDDKKKYNYISNACDYEHFSKAKERIYPKPSDIPEVSKPILGYYGAFSEWLDYELIKKYADEGNYHILMIGGIPNNSKYNIKFEHENITWLEHKQYEQLPIYLSWFDVCFLPFKECELNKYVNPCKLWEYKASEKEIIKSYIDIDCNKLVRYEDECEKIKNIFNKKNNILIVLDKYKKGGVEKHTDILEKELNCDIMVFNESIKNHKKINNKNYKNYDIILWQNTFGLLPNKQPKQKYIYIVHSQCDWWSQNNIETIKKNNDLIDYYIFVSESVKENFEKNVLVSKNSYVIENQLETIENNKEEISGLYVSCGSYNELKGHFELIQEFSKLDKNTNKLEIYGDIHDINYYDMLNTFINDNNLENIKLYKYTENYLERLKEAEYFCLFSKSEGCSYAILEAIALNKKIICTEECLTSKNLKNYANRKLNNFIFDKSVQINKINYNFIQLYTFILNNLLNKIEIKLNNFNNYFNNITNLNNLEVNIITASYNSNVNYFEELENCLYKQSYLNWLWIIVNDGTTNLDSINYLNNLQERHKNIIIVSHKFNKGLPSARNTGWNTSNSKYLFFIDDDDLISNDCIEKSLNFLNFENNVTFINYYYKTFGKTTRTFTYSNKRGFLNLFENGFTSCFMIRNINLRFDNNMKTGCEDWDFFLNCIYNKYYGYTIEEILFHYREKEINRNWNYNILDFFKKKYYKLYEDIKSYPYIIIKDNKIIYKNYNNCIYDKDKLKIEETEYLKNIKNYLNYDNVPYYYQDFNTLISTKLTGGFGNQLFMIFNLLALSKKFNKNFNIEYDDKYPNSYFKTNNIIRKTFDEYKIFNYLKKYKSTSNIFDYENYNEPEFKYNEINLEKNKNYNINGYFQSYKYFWDYKDEIKNYLCIDENKINNYKNLLKNFGKKIISIHLRLGDYEKLQDFHPIQPIEYFKTILDNFDLNEYQIILFSDDINKANEKLKPLNIQYIFADDLLTNDEEQFLLMCLCDIKICSNSTFSLMSCYFNEIYKFVNNPIYYIPYNWFGSKGPVFNIYDIIPINNNNFKLITNFNNYQEKNIIISLENININFLVKVLTQYNFNNFNIVIYKNNLSDKDILMINDIFPNIIILNENLNLNKLNILNYKILITDNIKIAENAKNKIVYLYTIEQDFIKSNQNFDIIIVNDLLLNLHFGNMIVFNIDNNTEYKIIFKDDKLELIKNIDKDFIKKNNYSAYVNTKILNLLNFIKYEEKIFTKIKLEKICNNGFYTKNGIVKYKNNFFIKNNNYLEKIDIKLWFDELNYIIDYIYYEDIEDINNYDIINNLELHFTILILSYNNEKYVIKNLESALKQKYNNFDVIYINCNSSDNTLKIAENVGNNYKNFYLFNNVERTYQTENFILGTTSAKNNSIIVSLDGDDWLYDDNVLTKLNKIYLATRCMLTYGQYIEYPYKEINFARNNMIEYIKSNKFREEKKTVSHLRTWMREIILNIEYEDILYINNELPKMAGDISILTYLIEICNIRTTFINDRMYVYNKTNQISDNIVNEKLQIDTADYFFNKKPYEIIFGFNENNKNKNKIINNFYNDNICKLLIIELLEFYYRNEVNDKKHLLELPYLFNKKELTNKYIFDNPVLSKNIYINFNYEKNIFEYLDNIKNDYKLKLYNKNKDICDFNKLNIQELIFNYLEYHFNKNIIDFKTINFDYFISKTQADINIIIPVKERKENLIALIENIKKNTNDFNIMITVIEYNDTIHKQFCIDNSINYITLNCLIFEFNKSLIANFSYKLYDELNIKYNYILFHDVDCLIKNNFFKNIFELNFNKCFIQPYFKKRVLYTNKELANNIRNNIIDINDVDENTKGIIEPGIGSSGGSIFMKKEMFENIGGLDYYYFDCYGPEDLMFFSKLLTLYDVEFTNKNTSNIIHLWHESKISTMKSLKSLKYNMFTTLNKKYKLKLLDIFKNHLLNNNIFVKKS